MKKWDQFKEQHLNETDFLTRFFSKSWITDIMETLRGTEETNTWNVFSENIWII